MSFATDSFTGADGTVLETYSANWTKIAGGSGSDFVINTNRVYCSTAGVTWQMHYWNAAQATNADYDVTVVINRAAGSDSIGPAGRLSTNNADGYHVKYLSGSGWVLYQRSANTVSQLGSYYNGDDPNGSPKTVMLRMVGTAISVLIGGTVRIGPATGAVTAKGYAGIGSYYTGGTSSFYLDDFDASDPVAAGPTITGGTANPVHLSTGNTLTGVNFGASQTGSAASVIGGVGQTETGWNATTVTYTADRGINGNGVAVNAVITDPSGVSSDPYALTGFQPPAGWVSVTLVSVEADPAMRLQSSADLAIGNQIEWDDATIEITDSGVPVWPPGTPDGYTFNFRVWVSGSGWGATEVATLNPAASGGDLVAPMMHRFRRLAMR